MCVGFTVPDVGTERTCTATISCYFISTAQCTKNSLLKNFREYSNRHPKNNALKLKFLNFMSHSQKHISHIHWKIQTVVTSQKPLFYSLNHTRLHIQQLQEKITCTLASPSLMQEPSGHAQKQYRANSTQPRSVRKIALSQTSRIFQYTSQK